LSFYQFHFEIGPEFNGTLVDLFVRHINEINSTSFLLLTVYPHQGLDLPKSTFDAFVDKMSALVTSGFSIMIRYASEMNGSWFAYGLQPDNFKAKWRELVYAIRNKTMDHPERVAFLWSPNLGVGYPYKGYGLNLPYDPSTDTNGDGTLSEGDDPYSPYYPGDDVVDWVGMSIYHYGNGINLGFNL
jgi:beta-mannanase